MLSACSRYKELHSCYAKWQKLDAADLRVIIPVGGQARRLKPLTAETSKPVVRIFNRPLVEIAMSELALQGVRNFIFGVKGFLNYRGLYAYFEEGIGFSARYGISPRVHIKYQPHIDDVGSADSIRINMDYYNINEPVMIVQADNIYDLDLKDLLAFHDEKKPMMTVVLTYVEDVERYGIAEIDSDNRIRRFVEKPRKEESSSRLANTGMYLLSPEVKDLFKHPLIINAIQEKKRLDFGMDFIPFLVNEGYPVYGYVLKGDWFDVGTPESYLDTMLRVLKSSKKTLSYFGEPIPGLGRVWVQGQSPESAQRKEEIMSKVREGEVRLEGSVVIGRHCQIGDGTLIKDTCIDNFCIIGEGVTIERSAILDRAVIGGGADIQDSIIGRNSSINSSRSRPSWIIGVSVVGDDVVIGEGCVMTAAKVFPHIVIPDGQRIINQTIE